MSKYKIFHTFPLSFSILDKTYENRFLMYEDIMNHIQSNHLTLNSARIAPASEYPHPRAGSAIWREGQKEQRRVIHYTMQSRFALFKTFVFIVTCISDYRRGSDWWIDLLITYKP
jgi:hypothetical protein